MPSVEEAVGNLVKSVLRDWRHGSFDTHDPSSLADYILGDIPARSGLRLQRHDPHSL